ncbi:MAG: 1-acyl-sn-glycerol-3-phosphate acyltransferase, partial [Candidatus Aminicenantes bacterium]
MRVEVEGAENISPDQSYVVVANHQSQYDIPLIYG